MAVLSIFVMGAAVFAPPRSALSEDLKQVPKFIAARYLDAARRGEAKAQFTVGYLHEKGMMEKSSLGRAAHWYGLAAGQGYAPAQYRLGLLYQRGALGPTDRGKALELFQMAAEQGLSEAQYNVGYILQKRGNYQEARQWYEQAADKGLAIAMRGLGLLYADGEGGEQDLTTAYVWLVRAVSAGDKGAVRYVSQLDSVLSESQRKKAQAILDRDL